MDKPGPEKGPHMVPAHWELTRLFPQPFIHPFNAEGFAMFLYIWENNMGHEPLPLSTPALPGGQVVYVNAFTISSTLFRYRASHVGSKGVAESGWIGVNTWPIAVTTGSEIKKKRSRKTDKLLKMRNIKH